MLSFGDDLETENRLLLECSKGSVRAMEKTHACTTSTGLAILAA